MISTKDFDELSEENIFNRISGYDIFRYYVTNFQKVSKHFCSDLRNDRTPSAIITYYDDKFWYKDFVRKEHKFSPVGYVMYKHSLNYYEALKMINNDFHLRLGTQLYRPIKRTDAPATHDISHLLSKKDNAVINIVSKKYNGKSKAYWMQYHIKQKTLDFFRVKPLLGFYIDKKFFRVGKNRLAYAYCFGNYKYKILQPYDKTTKWLSNTSTNIIQGYQQLPKTGDLLFITSSLKDVMVLYELGYTAIAPISEVAEIPQSVIEELRKRFKEIIVFYDNDSTGIERADNLKVQYGLESVFIPKTFINKNTKEPLKDPSDFCKQEGTLETRCLIDSLL